MTTVLQRHIFPAEPDPDVLALYAEGDPGTARDEHDDDAPNQAPSPENISQVRSRHSYRVPPSHRTSFGTYFNAFPAAYWARYTNVDSVQLVLQVRGTGVVLIQRSNPFGQSYRVQSAQIDTPTATTLTFDLPLDTFGDGGWYWWDAVAADSELIIESALWQTDAKARVGDAKATIAITTHNRPADCLAVLTQLSNYPPLFDYVAEIVVVDQGDKQVRAQTNFAQVAELLGDKLRIIEQPNLGGSGGFSRGMMEALATDTAAVLLLDDDVRVEPEGVCRAVQFYRMSREEIIVGGHMFSMYERAKLHAFAEGIDVGAFWWGPAEGTRHGHDFSQQSLRTTKWMHERSDATYNGWWMCLIPTAVLRKIGLSLPLFIKWDDSEFGLRAKRAGITTVSLPGAALWHVPWTAKDDSLDWQAYFHERNRLIAALMHSDAPKRLIQASFAGQVKHLVSMQYSVVELRDLAIRDVLGGPAGLHDQLTQIIPRIRKVRAKFPDAQVRASVDDFPAHDGVRLAGSTVRRRAKSNPVRKAIVALNGIRKQLRVVNAEHTARPQVRISFPAARWWTLSQYDSALVSNSDGSGVSMYVRDRERFTKQLKRTIALHRQLSERWDELAAQYRGALSDIVSVDQWAQTCGGPSVFLPSQPVDADR